MPLLLILLSACITDVEALYDRDGDGYGAVEAGCDTCTDCDDSNANVNVDAAELCDDDLDNDCDGVTDDVGVGSDPYFTDGDGDGFGSGNAVESCERPDGYAAVDGDCDDADANIRPDAVEVCNERDDNCNGTADEGIVPPTWYADADTDGFGDADATTVACAAPSGYVDDDTDCDDTDGDVFPGATDAWYDGVDSDCAGDSDYDADGDGFDSDLHSGTDCDDDDAAIAPDATEICNNGIDEDCDGMGVGCELVGELGVAAADVHFSSSNREMGEMLSVGDVNGDGIDDVFTRGEQTYPGRIYYGPLPATVDTTDGDVSVVAPSPGLTIRSDVSGDGVDDVILTNADVFVHYGGNVPPEIEFGSPADAHIAAVSAGLAVGATGIVIAEPPNSNVELWSTPIAGALAGGGDQSAVGSTEWGHDIAWVGNAGGGSSDAFLVSSSGGDVALLTTPLQASIGDYPAFSNLSDPLPVFPNRPGDLTNDGTHDVVLGSEYQGGVYIVAGPITNTVSMASYTGPRINTARSDNSEFPSAIALVDLNGDGFDDLAIGDQTSVGGVAEGGYVDIFYGPLDHITGTITTDDADLTIVGPGGAMGGIGSALDSGDVNGDGVEDLVIADQMGGKVYVYYGSGL